jgi:hypothetical protein
MVECHILKKIAYSINKIPIPQMKGNKRDLRECLIYESK